MLTTLFTISANAKILRVSNVKGTTAPYSSVEAALENCEDGDIIMVDASPYSYGSVDINKSITLQGPGFYLASNGITQEGPATSTFETITVSAEGAKISSVSVSRLTTKANKVIITRNWIGSSCSLSGHNGIVIHQNYIKSGISGTEANNVQITNNIIGAHNDVGSYAINRVNNSYVKYNTFTYDTPHGDSYSRHLFSSISNCVIENNIGNFCDTFMDNNTFKDNMGYPSDYYENIRYENILDSKIKELDEAISTSHGAFAGDDPYVISGVAVGPVIEDIEVPASVEQGNDMEVKVTIGRQK